MPVEKPIIGINIDAIQEEEANFDSREYMREYKPALIQEVFDNHKPIYNIFRTHMKQHGPKYVNSALMSYGLVVDRLNDMGIQVELDMDDARAHYQGRKAVMRDLTDADLDPNNWPEMLSGKDEKSPFEDFITDLCDTSPDYFNYLEQKLAKTPQVLSRRDIVFGVFDAVMPFFGRLESANMQLMWDNTPELPHHHPEWVDLDAPPANPHH